MDTLDIAATAALVALTAICYTYSKSTSRKLPLPPSPKSYPLIGNILVLPERNEHITYRQWSKEFKSDVLLIKVPGQSLIIINSAKAASDIFEKRSRRYLGRPHIPLVMEPTLIDWTRHIAFLPYGERWKQQRHLMHISFRKNAVHVHSSALARHARQAVVKIIANSEIFVEILGRMLTLQILSCVYGYEATSPDDEMVKLSESTTVNLGKALLPFNFMVNIFPGLKRLPAWLPGMGWKSVAKEWNEELQRTISLPYQHTIKQIASGTAAPSALREMITSLQSEPEKLTEEQRDRAMWTAGSVFTAAVESLHATLQIMVLIMTLYSEVQAKMQHEIEQVTEGKRLPELGDMERMPYVRCVILEILRWQPAGPLGIPHACEEDDEYNGYTIPKGSLVFGNMWAINRDESRYKDPDSFVPERFMDPSTPEPVVFGFGRRICPGMHFTHASLFINLVTLLATCHIRPMQDENGREILPAFEMVQGPVALSPAPFKCMIVPRSEAHKQMLVESGIDP